jgi:hypothetical protein
MTVLEHIKQLSESLNDEQRRSLAAFLSSRESPENRQLRDLYGIWKGAFPGDFDVDDTLHEIRGEWQKEIQEIAP